MGLQAIRIKLDYPGHHDPYENHPIIADDYPPEGEGYAIFYTVVDLVISPVFKSLRELCEWVVKERRWIDYYRGVNTVDEWFEQLRGWVGE